jgi:site-specific DNA-methyltransferase (cytosine-N4-specific)
MLTEVCDLVVDPFCGSCATGEAAERTRREWICCDMVEDYLEGALGRFLRRKLEKRLSAKPDKPNGTDTYRAFKPGLLWNGVDDDQPLAADGGATRTVPVKQKKVVKAGSYQPKQATLQMMLLEKPQPSKRKALSSKTHG